MTELISTLAITANLKAASGFRKTFATTYRNESSLSRQAVTLVYEYMPSQRTEHQKVLIFPLSVV